MGLRMSIDRFYQGRRACHRWSDSWASQSEIRTRSNPRWVFKPSLQRVGLQVYGCFCWNVTSGISQIILIEHITTGTKGHLWWHQKFNGMPLQDSNFLRLNVQIWEKQKTWNGQSGWIQDACYLIIVIKYDVGLVNWGQSGIPDWHGCQLTCLEVASG